MVPDGDPSGLAGLVPVLVAAYEHVGEASINGPPDEASHVRAHVQCTWGETCSYRLIWWLCTSVVPKVVSTRITGLGTWLVTVM